MSRPFESKLAIVTGASRGIGLAIAEALAARGANLVLAYTSASSFGPTEVLAKELAQKHSIKAVPIKADLSTPDGPASLISQASQIFSPLRIDILINNAGINLGGPLPTITTTDFQKSYDTNVRGPLLLVQAAQPYLPTDRSGRIVNISSASSTLGLPGQSIYGATKAALEAMTRTWARELSENATVNAINPGPVQTDMWNEVTDDFANFIRPYIQTTPLMAVREGVDPREVVEKAKVLGGRAALPEEIAGAVVMLCLKEAAWITGQVVGANGGAIFGK
ncbi:hypothetical protein HDV00_012187 [Rhizophlyctis rosea]|nr:hypothetical protein HDV00_012187 [Rhizophlyctis rosea]